MNITKAKYYKDFDGKNVSVNATIDGQDMSVPMDSANRHYDAIQEWAKIDGNTIADAD